MAEVKLTRAQQAVVENRGGALLVSAAAGSGKTKVLVDRLLSYVEDPIDPANIDEFLIITYTKAAASELRGKISAEISKRLAVRPDNRHLQRQLTRIHLAQISTVHAFCAMLLRRYCTLRDLPPDFRVAEQTEADAIRLEVFQNTLEDFYKDRANQADFSAMADQLGFGRDDRRLIDLCLSCYDEVRCRRDMDGWMKKAEAAYECVSPLEESPWGAFWMKELQDTLRFASESLQKAIALLRRDETLEEKYGPVFEKNLAQVQALRRPRRESRRASGSLRRGHRAFAAWSPARRRAKYGQAWVTSSFFLQTNHAMDFKFPRRTVSYKLRSRVRSEGMVS